MAFKFIIISVLLTAVSAGYLSPVATHVVTKVANPAYDAVATTHQNVVRSFDGTVSQYSKSVHTPYSSVHKEDTRVHNNVYSPAITKTVSYATPAAAHHTVAYSGHSTPVVSKVLYNHQQPTQAVYAPYAATPAVVHQTVAHSGHSTPVVSKVLYNHQQPSQAVYAPYAAHKVYTQEQPAHSVHVAATPATTVFSHQQEVYAPYAAHKAYTQEQPAHSVHVAATPATTVFSHQQEIPSTATTIYNHGPAATTYSHSSPSLSAYGSKQTIQYSPAEMVSHMSFDGFGTHWGF